MTHQPAISFSITFQFPFNRAGGRTSNVRQRMEPPPPESLSPSESPSERHVLSHFLLLGPVTGALVGYAQETVAVVFWVLHGTPDFYYRGGSGVFVGYLTNTIGGSIVGVAYGAVLCGLENLTNRRIQPILSLGILLPLASIAGAFNFPLIC